MAPTPLWTPDPNLDLVLQREIDIPPHLVYEMWTKPEHVVKYFVPAPWTITECEIDLRPGGMFRSVMRSPEGTEYPNMGCFLEIVPNERLVCTDALLPGYRPSKEPFMTAIITMEPRGNGGTLYTATAIHRDEEQRRKHEEMGFHHGWGIVLDQLVAYAKTV